MKCTNFVLCNQPIYHKECFNGHCTKCFILFSFYKHGQLSFYSIQSREADCNNCFTQGVCYTLPNCSHQLCKECFTENYYDPIPKAPDFPYNADTELAYYENPTSFKTDRKIITYFNEWNQWDTYNKKLSIKHQSCIICNTNEVVGIIFFSGMAVFYLCIPLLFKMIVGMCCIYITKESMLVFYH